MSGPYHTGRKPYAETILMFGLQYLIAPRGVDEFRDQYIGQRSLYVPDKGEKFRDLFDWSDVNHVVNYQTVQFPRFRLVHDKHGLPPHELSRVDHWLKQGATLVLNNVQLSDPVVERFAASLGNDMNTLVNVNCYVSMPAKQGFDLHYDRHDVFVVQLAGTKQWKVFEPTVKWPVEQQQADQDDKPTDATPYLECELSTGDVLYIPRGHWHYALAETPSIHFTVGPQPRTGIDFLLWLTQQAMGQEEFFRRDFPILGVKALGGEYSDESIEKHLDTFRRHLLETVEEDELKAQFVKFCMVSNPIRKERQLPHIASLADEIAPETAFRIPADQKLLANYNNQTQSAVLTARGFVFNIFHIPERFLEVLLDGASTITGAGILAECPELAWDRVRDLLLEMFDQGLLVIKE